MRLFERKPEQYSHLQALQNSPLPEGLRAPTGVPGQIPPSRCYPKASQPRYDTTDIH